MNIVLVDANNILMRCLFALDTRNTDIPVASNAPINTFFNQIAKYARITFPSKLMLCWDGGTSKFRTELLPTYKGNRNHPPKEEGDDIFQRTWNVAYQLGLNQIRVPDVEADDVIAQYTRQYKDDNFVYIISSDKDFAQLLDDSVAIYRPGYPAPLTLERWNSEHSYTPEQYVIVLALMGDKVDNIPGVGGVGIKRAAKLLQDCDGSITQILADAPPKFDKEAFVRNIALVDLRSGYVEMNLPPIGWFDPVENPKDYRWEDLKRLLDHYRLRQLKASIIQGNFWE